MKISTKGRYALRLMLDLAQQEGDRYISLKEISSRQGISVKYLEQIIGNLCKAGLVQSSRGAQGGYRLTRPPGEYTIGAVLRTTEGNLSPVACLDQQPNQCSRCDDCITLEFWTGLARVIDEYVDGTTLQDLIDRHQGQEASNYVI
ncbi:MAG: Rrf2 family transcriptional regulator [Clostridiales bacterium]|nr:Rrf2 family transcriptional regulator [Clostridiales bacterium]